MDYTSNSFLFELSCRSAIEGSLHTSTDKRAEPSKVSVSCHNFYKAYTIDSCAGKLYNLCIDIPMVYERRERFPCISVQVYSLTLGGRPGEGHFGCRQ